MEVWIIIRIGERMCGKNEWLNEWMYDAWMV